MWLITLLLFCRSVGGLEISLVTVVPLLCSFYTNVLWGCRDTMTSFFFDYRQNHIWSYTIACEKVHVHLLLHTLKASWQVYLLWRLKVRVEFIYFNLGVRKYLGKHSGGLWTSLEKETPQPLYGSLLQCSVTLTGSKFSVMFRWNFPCSNLCPPFILSLGTTEESLAPSSWLLPFRYL